MNIYEEHDMWKRRLREGEDCFQLLLERGMAMFYTHRDHDFLADFHEVMGALESTAPMTRVVTIGEFQDWKSGITPCPTHIQDDIIAVLDSAAKRHLNLTRHVMLGQVEAVLTTIHNLPLGNANRDKVMRIGGQELLDVIHKAFAAVSDVQTILLKTRD